MVNIKVETRERAIPTVVWTHIPLITRHLSRMHPQSHILNALVIVIAGGLGHHGQLKGPRQVEARLETHYIL